MKRMIIRKKAIRKHMVRDLEKMFSNCVKSCARNESDKYKLFTIVYTKEMERDVIGIVNKHLG